MKTTLIGALVCAAISVASIRIADAVTIAAPVIAPQAVTVTEATDRGGQTPTLTRVWWAGPNTVCHHAYYGGAYCHPAYARLWIPGHHTWNGFWIPGHWA